MTRFPPPQGVPSPARDGARHQESARQQSWTCALMSTRFPPPCMAVGDSGNDSGTPQPHALSSELRAEPAQNHHNLINRAWR